MKEERSCGLDAGFAVASVLGWVGSIVTYNRAHGFRDRA